MYKNSRLIHYFPIFLVLTTEFHIGLFFPAIASASDSNDPPGRSVALTCIIRIVVFLAHLWADVFIDEYWDASSRPRWPRIQVQTNRNLKREKKKKKVEHISHPLCDQSKPNPGWALGQADGLREARASGARTMGQGWRVLGVFPLQPCLARSRRHFVLHRHVARVDWANFAQGQR
jgi:hypothetical protein